MANIVTAQEVLDWASPEAQANIDQAHFSNVLIPAAELAVEELAGVFIQEKTSQTETVDGDGPRVNGATLLLDRRMLNLQGITQVTENGVILTGGTGYDLAADFITDLAGFRLLRQVAADASRIGVWPKKQWASGVQNITIALGDYGFDSANAPMMLKNAIKELAWLFFKTPQMLGKTGRSKKGLNETFLKELNPLTREYINSLQPWGAPT